MARLNTRQPSSDSEPKRQPIGASRRSPSGTTPPSSEVGSDKENRTQARPSKGKRKSNTASMADGEDAESSSARKRRKVSGTNPHSQAAHRKELEKVDKRYYDPEQDPQERREIRKNFRSLYSKYNDSKSDYLAPNNKGLEETLREADKLYKSVKQTSDATIDSRLLVDVADSSFKKINNLTLGDETIGIDTNDFISRCVAFMKQGDITGHNENRSLPTSTQTQRRRRRNGADEDDDEEQGDTMNWAYLGQNACFLYNQRPCLTGFLLGPLSVQKKVRQQTQRKAREARSQVTQTMRPIELGNEDLEKQESASLTVICTEIARLLNTAQDNGRERADAEYNKIADETGETPSDEEGAELLRRHGMADNACVPLFNFCINPKSFGQTVENMFYVSFLIKEGKVGLDFDSQGLPTLGIAHPRSMAERQQTQRNQVVFTLDFDVWQDIVKSFGIQKCIIPHRKEEKYDDGIIDYARPEDDEVREPE